MRYAIARRHLLAFFDVDICGFADGTTEFNDFIEAEQAKHNKNPAIFSPRWAVISTEGSFQRDYISGLLANDCYDVNLVFEEYTIAL